MEDPILTRKRTQLLEALRKELGTSLARVEPGEDTRLYVERILVMSVSHANFERLSTICKEHGAELFLLSGEENDLRFAVRLDRSITSRHSVTQLFLIVALLTASLTFTLFALRN